MRRRLRYLSLSCWLTDASRRLGVVHLHAFYANKPLELARTAAALGSHDHGAIVIDEIVGMLLTVSFCSSGPIGVLVGFCAFRFFDIVKPWPIRLADARLGGGLGIMFDDLLAAGYALAVLEIFEYFSFGYRMFQ